VHLSLGHEPEEGKKVRVFIADDSSLVVERLVAMLAELQHVEIIGHAADARAATQSIRNLKPHVVILDLHMPGTSGFEVLRNIKRERPKIIVMILTNHADNQYQKMCLAAGADFFLDKSGQFNMIPELFQTLARGAMFT
jgi:DNA-binding NarL/FixJ family response regulator